jgi:hypothetical protein
LVISPFIDYNAPVFRTRISYADKHKTADSTRREIKMTSSVGWQKRGKGTKIERKRQGMEEIRIKR